MAKPSIPRYTNESLPEVLAPDPQDEKGDHITDNKFAFTPGQLNKLLNPKSLDAFHAVGGLHGLEYGLQTDLTAGLSADETTLLGYATFAQVHEIGGSNKKGFPEYFTGASVSLPRAPSPPFSDRRRVFGRNVVPAARRKSFLRLLWDAYNDKILILLTIAAVVSLSLGIYEAVSGQSQVDWIEGVAVCIAIVIVVGATAGNDWQKAKQFAKLNRRVIYMRIASWHVLTSTEIRSPSESGTLREDRPGAHQRINRGGRCASGGWGLCSLRRRGYNKPWNQVRRIVNNRRVGPG